MPKEDIERLIAAAVTNKEVEERLLRGEFVSAAEKAKENNPKSQVDLDEYDMNLLGLINAKTLADFAAEVVKKLNQST